MINSERLVNEFCKLVEIDATSFNERKMADYIKSVFNEMGIELKEDNAGSYYGSDAGNLYGFIKGEISGTPLLFSAHLDTVEPGKNKRAVFHNDIIRSKGDTVLGADDLAGVAEIIEGIRTLKEKNIPHRDIEVLFPIAEEVYIKGTNVFDFSSIKSKQGYVLDLSGRVGTAALSAPSLISFDVVVKGKAAHAGFAPEEGVNSVAAAALALSEIKQGRIDECSTLNIGMISGGIASNIVPESCSLRGEIRSLKHNTGLEILENVKKRFENACNSFGADLDFNYSIDLTAYEIKKASKAVEYFEKACNALNIETEYISTFGGSDNNNFVRNGIESIVIACGMNDVHSCNEYTSISELNKSAEIVLGLMTMEDK